jgi:hypothetical protein
MIIENKKYIAAAHGAKTGDIISALCMAVPAAVNQIEAKDLPLIKPGQNKIKYLYNIARQIQKDIKYKADGFELQKIQLPGHLYKTRIGDCKSLSLLFLALATKAGFTGGFRFVSYRTNKIPTHVYNFILINDKKLIFDLCTSDLNESKKYTFKKDMRVQYLSGIPTMLEDNSQGEFIGRKRQPRNPDKPKKGKQIALFPIRAAFLTLVEVNFRGIATKLDKLNKKSPAKLKELWLKLGGDPAKLVKNIDQNKGKKPLLGAKINGLVEDGAEFIGENDEFIGAPTLAAITAAIAAAAPILLAVTKLLQKEGIQTEELAPAGSKPLDPTGEGFTASDPETTKTPGPIIGFMPSPLLIGGAVAAIALIYFLTSKKSRK